MREQLNYLHCMIDEKFLDGAISLFETDKRVNNTYALFQDGNKGNNFKFIQSNIVKCYDTKDFLRIVRGYNVVVLHSLTSLPLSLISAIPHSIKVVWLMWGADFYNYEVCNLKLLYPLTKKALSFRNYLGILKTKLLYPLRKGKYAKALNRIDYFSGVFPYEYNLFVNLPRYPGIKAKSIDFYYGSTDFFIPEIPNGDFSNLHKNIIVGNSADPRNNTIDAFRILEKYIETNSIDNIIVPLSYGNNKVFKNNVKQLGSSLWGEKFKPLDRYMPLQDYLKLVSNCISAVFFHERQQASDNVLMQMLYGARVYMSETSLMFKYLKDKGFIVFSLQKDADLICTPLSNEEVMRNRQLLSQNYSSSQLIERIKTMNDVIRH